MTTILKEQLQADWIKLRKMTKNMQKTILKRHEMNIETLKMSRIKSKGTQRNANSVSKPSSASLPLWL